MIRGKLLRPGSDISQALHVRDAVFVREQGYSAALEHDEIDRISWHALVYDQADASGEPAGDACGTAASGGRTASFTWAASRCSGKSAARGWATCSCACCSLRPGSTERGASRFPAQLQAVPFTRAMGSSRSGNRFWTKAFRTSACA